ncbi:MAG TPA: PIG-L deacetylase family protein [Acidimicrobiales bacterium]|jgi:LmbE family N-acetylglucosaminyl deacetylase|nr:PIG-L deacetylase family protein [Acidimicrobiales bacterium]
MVQEAVERALAIVAHPDDVDFGAAGTVANWTDAGTRVTYCIVTDGAAGGFDPGVPRSEMAGLRQDEQRAAAKVVGVEDVVFLGYPDGRLQPSLELRQDLSRVIRQVRPDRVLTASPERNWARLPASHPDHLSVGEAAMCAVYPDARNPFAFPSLLEEGLQPHVVPEVWLMGSPRADHFVDITANFERKVAALLCHASQLPDPDAVVEMVRAWTAATAEQVGDPACRHAEAFFVVRSG